MIYLSTSTSTQNKNQIGKYALASMGKSALLGAGVQSAFSIGHLIKKTADVKTCAKSIGTCAGICAVSGGILSVLTSLFNIHKAKKLDRKLDNQA